MHRFLLRAVSCAAVGLAASTPAPARQPFSQPPQPSGFTGAGSNSLVVRSADNFRLSTAAAITELHWWGGVFSGPPAASESFQVRIFRDASAGTTPTVPGILLSTAVIPWDQISRTDIGLTDNLDDTMFQYKAPFAASLPANSNLWISISNIGSGWVWYTSGSGDNRTAYEYPDFGIPWSAAQSDLAFELVVPAPELLPILSCAPLIGRRRR